MLTSHFFLFFVVQTLLQVVVQTYKIDQSCSKEGIEQDVRDAMTSAFEMADAAVRRLSTTTWDQDTTDLIANLFAREGQTAQDIQTVGVNEVFRNIRAYYRTEATDGNEVAANDLVSAS